ncbi:hypothetical protein FSARC_4775 [Fusarium sarcochroum]|uniref:Uncharacterized protein n=1 Tax=Fusarium sarcochroum TaxID=1208366 RepID=A0A8H4XB56_9HYPO|nr:hypothetical protein FSARC_4775 [Fusarium sarcochroum]
MSRKSVSQPSMVTPASSSPSKSSNIATSPAKSAKSSASLFYAPQAKEEGVLPLPIGDFHKFAPVALVDVAQAAAHVLTGKGKHGFDDRHRGQTMVSLTPRVLGPMLYAGKELAAAASKVLGTDLQFENISHAEAKRALKSQSELDQSE